MTRDTNRTFKASDLINQELQRFNTTWCSDGYSIRNFVKCFVEQYRLLASSSLNERNSSVFERCSGRSSHRCKFRTRHPSIHRFNNRRLVGYLVSILLLFVS
ncbi:hypothetical protein AHF37_12603 [Paragonimus kellicotti]|nr:hypothetical protein AHF37_12603 [Paragonimus kellicotti]